MKHKGPSQPESRGAEIPTSAEGQRVEDFFDEFLQQDLNSKVQQLPAESREHARALVHRFHQELKDLLYGYAGHMRLNQTQRQYLRLVISRAFELKVTTPHTHPIPSINHESVLAAITYIHTLPRQA